MDAPRIHNTATDELLTLVHLDVSDIDWDLGKARQAFGLIRELGGNAVRTDMPWADLEPEPGQWQMDKLAWFEAYWAEANAMGLTPMPVLVQPPAWALKIYRQDCPTFLAYWRQYCARAAETMIGHVRLVQAWNEPGNPFLGLFDNRYPHPGWADWSCLADLLTVAAEELHATLDPLEIVVNSAVDMPGWDKVMAYLIEKAGDAFDIIGIDHYPGTWAFQDAGDWAILERVLTRVNDPDDAWHGKHVAIVETGYSTFMPWLKTEDHQTRWVEQALPAIHTINQRWRDQGGRSLRMVGWYELYDEPDGRLIPPLARFGVMRHPAKAGYTSRKAAFHTLRHYMYQLRSTVPAHEPAARRYAEQGRLTHVRSVDS